MILRGRSFEFDPICDFSVKMVLMWTSGDTFKTCYFIVKKVPKQFPAGAIMQVIVDILIMMQVWVYRGKVRHPVRQE